MDAKEDSGSNPPIATGIKARRGLKARPSIVRISYDWKPNEDKIILAGIVISKNEIENSCQIIANSTIFELSKETERKTKSFGITFPTSDEDYGNEVRFGYSDVKSLDATFITFNVSFPDKACATYVKPASFETSEVRQKAQVDAFYFPRENFVTPPIYSPGYVIEASAVDEVFFVDCPLDEFAHYGSPLFNQDGCIVGVIFESQVRSHAWKVKYLEAVLVNMGVRFV